MSQLPARAGVPALLARILAAQGRRGSVYGRPGLGWIGVRLLLARQHDPPPVRWKYAT